MPTQNEIAKAWGTSRPYVAMCKKHGCPTHTIAAATKWREANASKRVSPSAKAPVSQKPAKGKKAGRPRALPEPSKTGDSLLDALNNAIYTADMAYIAYRDAVLTESPTMAARLSESSKATQVRIVVEKAYREEQERRSVLVPKPIIIERCRKGMEAVLKMLNKLPSEQGPQCNPDNPIMAMKVLQRKVDEIKIATQAAIGGLA